MNFTLYTVNRALAKVWYTCSPILHVVPALPFRQAGTSPRPFACLRHVQGPLSSVLEPTEGWWRLANYTLWSRGKYGIYWNDQKAWWALGDNDLAPAVDCWRGPALQDPHAGNPSAVHTNVGLGAESCRHSFGLCRRWFSGFDKDKNYKGLVTFSRHGFQLKSHAPLSLHGIARCFHT